jgi:putative ABC transport system ATP-binding protein
VKVGGRPVKVGSHCARLEDVEKSFARGPERIRVLAGLTLDIAVGEFLALMGPSGSGKSTLLNLLGGLERPDRGRVQVAGQHIEALAERHRAAWRARHVGFVFQFYNLLPALTARQNVALPLLLTPLSRSQRRRQAEVALALAGIGHRGGHYPGELSGGERQRVGIARALAADPALLLCDEPTGDLDRRAGDDVIRLLEALCRDRAKTVVMVTHDARASERASRILYLHDGRLHRAPPV